MNIGYIYDLQTCPPKGGNHVHALELTQGFLANGHRVCVVGDPTMQGVENFGDSVAELDKFLAGIDVLYVRVDARSLREWKVLNYCADHKGNLPMVWEINSPANEALAYSYLGGTKSWRLEDESLLIRAKRKLHALRKYPGIWQEEGHREKLAHDVDCAICVSQALGNYVSEGLEITNVKVLPNGGPKVSAEDVERRRSKRETTAFTVLYSGSAIYPWQGLNFLTATIRLAAEKAPDVRFVLAVNQLIDDLPSGSNVVIRQKLNREQIIDEICAADVCVAIHPQYPWSKWGFHNSPMKMFEYMACRRVVLTSNHGQMRDLINDGVDGVLCENNPEDILKKIVYLRDNPELVASMGKKGAERIEQEFSWENNVTETLSIFDQLKQAS